MAALLEASELACRRGGRLVFAGVGFSLDAGDALVLRGPNGSGKSSLLRVLAGLLQPAGGRLMWAGTALADDPPSHRRRVHHVGHAQALKSGLSVRENVSFAAALAGGGREELEGALAAFDLGALAGAPVRLLSAGQRRRTALARLLAAPRPVWLLDEPGVGLDQANRARLERAIARHRRGGGIAVIATHGDVAADDPLVLELGD